MGPVEEDASIVYLRPETAQGILRQVPQCPSNPQGKKFHFGIA